MIILLPACYSIPKTRLSEIPEDISFDIIPTWVSKILDVEPGQSTVAHSPEDVGNYINEYELSDNLKKSLIKLYWAYENELIPLEPSLKAIIVYKLKEGYEQCAKGFHERVDFCLMNFAPLITIEDYLYAERRSIVDKTAQKNVHTHRDYYSIAKSEFGLEEFTPEVTSSGFQEEAIIKKNLNNAFRKCYTPWKMMQSLLTGIQSKLHELGYTGVEESIHGYVRRDYERFQDSIYQFLGEPNTDELNQDFFIFDTETDVIRDINWKMIRRLLIQRLFREARKIDDGNHDEYPLYFAVSSELKEAPFFSSLIAPDKEISFDDLSKDWFHDENELLDFFSFFDVHEIENQYLLLKMYFGIEKLRSWSFVVKSIPAFIIQLLNEMSEIEKIQSLSDQNNQCNLACVFKKEPSLEAALLEAIGTLPGEFQSTFIQALKNKHHWKSLVDALLNKEISIEPLLESFNKLDSLSIYDILQVQDEMGITALMIAVSKRPDAVAPLLDMIKTLPMDLQCALLNAQEREYGFNSCRLAIVNENRAAITPLLEHIQTFPKKLQYSCLQVETDEECGELLLNMMENESSGVVPLIKNISTFPLDSIFAILQVRIDDDDDFTPIMYAAAKLPIAVQPLLEVIQKLDQERINTILDCSVVQTEDERESCTPFLLALEKNNVGIIDTLLAFIEKTLTLESQYNFLNARNGDGCNSLMNAIHNGQKDVVEKLLVFIDRLPDELKFKFFNAEDNLLELAVVYYPDLVVKLNEYIRQLSPELQYETMNIRNNLLMTAVFDHLTAYEPLLELFRSLPEELQLRMLSSKSVYGCIEKTLIKTPSKFQQLVEFIHKLPDVLRWQIVKPRAGFNLLIIALRGAVEVYMQAYEDSERAVQELSFARRALTQCEEPLQRLFAERTITLKSALAEASAAAFAIAVATSGERDALVTQVVKYINTMDDDRIKEYLFRDGHSVILNYLCDLPSLATTLYYINLIEGLKISIFPASGSKRQTIERPEGEPQQKRPRIEMLDSGTNNMHEMSDEENDSSYAYPSSPMRY